MPMPIAIPPTSCEPLAQQVEQRDARVDRRRVLDAVDAQADLCRDRLVGHETALPSFARDKQHSGCAAGRHGASAPLRFRRCGV